MKQPETWIARLAPLLMVTGLLVIAWLLTRVISDGSEITAMLETPVRDMKFGQVVGLIVFAWVLFK